MRSNAWLCLYIILHDNHQLHNIESLLSKSDQLSETNIELILSTISQFKSLDQTQSLIKQILSETCQFETNIFLLHYSILFIIDNCHIDSPNDQLLLSNFARALNRRHSILYLLIQYDKREKNCKLIEKYFHLMISMLIKKLQVTFKNPIEINSDENSDGSSSTNIQTYLILPNLNQDQIKLIKELQIQMNIKDDFPWIIQTNINNQKNQVLNQLAYLLQEFFLNPKSTPCFTTIKQFNPPIPIKQTQDEVKR
jgi:hypothetical protein